MSNVFPLERWKKQPMPEREAFSDEESDEEDSEYEKLRFQRQKSGSWKGRSQTPSESSSTPIRGHRKSKNRVQFRLRKRRKSDPGFESCARTSSWQASKAVQTKSIEALIHPFSNIIREGQTVYYCDPVTNVTSKYNQMQVPVIQFFMHFLRLDQKIFVHGGNPFWAQKKATRDVKLQ